MQVESSASASDSESDPNDKPKPSEMEIYLQDHGLELVHTYAYDAHTDGRSVVVAAHKDGRSVVVKLIRDTKTEFGRERDFAKLCAEFDIAPALLESTYIRGCGFMMLDCWPLSLDKLFASGLHVQHDNLKAIAAELRRLLAVLRQLGLVHADFLPKNIVCRIDDNRVQRMALIDFGITFQIDEVGKGKPWPDFDILKTYIYDPLHWKSMPYVLPKIHNLVKDPHVLDTMLLDYILFLQDNPC